MTQSRYTYNNTNVLINKLNIQDQRILDEYESVWSYRRISELYDSPITGSFDLAHLIKIHEYIFQDIFPSKKELKQMGIKNKLALRGELRFENIAKGDFQFASALYMEDGANDLFKRLKKDNYLLGLPLDAFIEKLAFYLAELNVLHVFREGNGRTSRKWASQLAKENGYILDWSIVNETTTLNAFILSVKDTTALENVLRTSLTPYFSQK